MNLKIEIIQFVRTFSNVSTIEALLTGAVLSFTKHHVTDIDLRYIIIENLFCF